MESLGTHRLWNRTAGEMRAEAARKHRAKQMSGVWLGMKQTMSSYYAVHSLGFGGYIILVDDVLGSKDLKSHGNYCVIRGSEVGA